MTTSLLDRNLDDELAAYQKHNATLNSRSPEAEHREVHRQALCADVILDFAELAAKIRKIIEERVQTRFEELMWQFRQER